MRKGVKMDNLKWSKLNEDQCSLYSESSGCEAILSYDDYKDIWILTNCMNFRDKFDAKSLEEAQWKATVKINNYCNEVIHNHMIIRDRLPDLGELYDSAFSKINTI
jgi:hypothetical protein